MQNPIHDHDRLLILLISKLMLLSFCMFLLAGALIGGVLHSSRESGNTHPAVSSERNDQTYHRSSEHKGNQRVAQYELRTGQMIIAIEKLREAERKNQASLDDIYNLAVAEDQMGSYAQAERLYKKVLAQRPKDAHALGGLGWVYFELGNYDSALQYSLQATEENPRLAQAQLNVGHSLLALGKLNKAMDVYITAVSKKMNSELVSSAIIDLSLLRRNPKAPFRNLVPYALAYFYSLMKDYAKQKQALEEFITMNPHHPLTAQAKEELEVLTTSLPKHEPPAAPHLAGDVQK